MIFYSQVENHFHEYSSAFYFHFQKGREYF